MNLELLKKEVLHTICEYIDAVQPNNLNYNYCHEKNIQAGICAYCHANDFKYLTTCLLKYSGNCCNYLFTTPTQILHKKAYLQIYKEKFEKLNFIDCHNARLKFLIPIFQEILFIESEKQKNNIYTYYKLISLFKF